jgi:demethylmenaquinone methyltransferase/2-methoxy-6-polyprenyl-1,4-benzoquinol methylase
MNSLKTNFGKRKVTLHKKTILVQKVFSDVAKNYDTMNDFMSFGAHRLWKSELIDLLNIQRKDKIIDVGSGTGDLIKLILKKNQDNSIYSVDLNRNMLNYSKKKFKNKNIRFKEANAETLPFPENCFDKYIISFCLRNVTNINKALAESFRVLKPGGAFYCLEFSTPETETINKVYNNYKKNIIPWLGEKIAKNRYAYKYLDESINLFPNQNELLKKIKKIGYFKSKYINIFNGIVTIHSGFKI